MTTINNFFEKNENKLGLSCAKLRLSQAKLANTDHISLLICLISCCFSQGLNGFGWVRVDGLVEDEVLVLGLSLAIKQKQTRLLIITFLLK